jgi:hypothetical protein
MVRCPSIVIASLLGIGLLLGLANHPALAQFADVQEEAAPTGDAAEESSAVPLLSADELRALVAPVALYPDELLAIVLPAATNPLQVVEAQRFLDKQKADPNLQPDAEWDPAVLALLNYPEVVKQMNDDLDWTQQLGNAVMDQQKDVLDAIQSARSSASDAGYLQSNNQQTVVNEGDNIVIESAQPEVVYVPTYDPAPIVNNTYVNYPPPIYSDPYPPYYAPAATFFAGAFVGAAFAYGFDWDNDDIDIDNDINISEGDINIGSGNEIDRTNIDKTELENRFNGDRKANADGKMKWSPEKARQKSTAPRKSQAANRPTQANIAKQLGSGGAGKANLSGQQRVKANKATKQQSQRGNASLANTKQPKQQLRNNAAQKQQVQRQKQQPQKQLQQRQTKQSQGGAFKMQPKNQAKAHSNRGSKSLKSAKQPRPNRR